MPNDKRKEYQATVDADKERYDSEMKEWNARNRAEGEKEAAAETSEATSTSSDDDESKNASGSDEDDEDDGEDKGDTKPAEKPKKRASAKKPQGSRSAYNFFMQENTEKFKEAHPDEEWPAVVSRIWRRRNPVVQCHSHHLFCSFTP